MGFSNLEAGFFKNHAFAEVTIRRSLAEGSHQRRKATPPSKEKMEAKKRSYPYRCEATSPEGFLQQLTASYLAHGYFFYVSGWLPVGFGQKVRNSFGLVGTT